MDTRTTIVDSLSLHASFEANQEAVQEETQKSIAPEDPMARARMLAAFNNAVGELRDEAKGEGVISTAQNPIASRMQSMMVEATLGETESFGLKLKQGINTQEFKFDNFDWIGWIPVGFPRLFLPKPFPFREPAPAAEPIAANKFRVAVFGDWGSGLYGAQPIAEAIKKDANYQIVLHLGDTYYSGSKKEFKSRFTELFPKPAGAVGRSLNGNHEMYSGGIPYIAAVEEDLGQKSSCFAWQNDHWLLVGLDTAYWDETTPAKDHVLNQREFDWLSGLLAAAGQRNVVLFSHHQLFSQNSGQGTHLIEKLKPILEAGRIHRLVLGPRAPLRSLRSAPHLGPARALHRPWRLPRVPPRGGAAAGRRTWLEDARCQGSKRGQGSQGAVARGAQPLHTRGAQPLPAPRLPHARVQRD